MSEPKKPYNNGVIKWLRDVINQKSDCQTDKIDCIWCSTREGTFIIIDCRGNLELDFELETVKDYGYARILLAITKCSENTYLCLRPYLDIQERNADFAFIYNREKGILYVRERINILLVHNRVDETWRHLKYALDKLKQWHHKYQQDFELQIKRCQEKHG